MNHLINNIVKKQKNELKEILKSAFVRRITVDKLIQSLDSGDIKVIVGPRRSGKSSLAIQALSGMSFAYFNFEDEGIGPDLQSEQLLEALEVAYPKFHTVLFDEIQQFPKWEQLANRLHRLGKNLVITGSNSKLLSSELASSLTGRYIEHQLLPFSFDEYLSAQSKAANLDHFLEFLLSGGFPSVATRRSQGEVFLPTLWDAILLKDLVQRYRIRRSVELKNLLYLLLTNMAAKSSARSLSRGLQGQLTHATVSKYVAWAESAYLCCLLHPFSFKARERVNAEKKVYLYDNGFYTSRKNFGAKDYGRLLENQVFIEICRQGNRPNMDFFFYQTKSKYEVDFFLTPAAGSKKLIQACYTIANQDTQKRECRALAQAARELNVTDLSIITCDEVEQTLTYDGFKIQIIPAWQTINGVF